MDSSMIEDVSMVEPTLPIELKASVFRPFAYRVLSKKYGLNVQSAALEKLASYVGRRFGTKWKRDPKTSAFLDALAKLWKEQGRGIFIDGNGVSQIIKEIIANEQRTRQRRIKNVTHNDMDDSNMDIDPDETSHFDTTTYDSSMILSSQAINTQTNDYSASSKNDKSVDWNLFFKVVDVNHYTNFLYDKKRKQFDYHPPESQSKILKLPQRNEILDYHIARLNLLRDRIYRNNTFSKKKYDENNQSKAVNQTQQPKHLTAVKNLLGRNEQRFALFGLVTLNSFGLWQLQDDTDKIELVLKQCIFADDSYFVSGNYLIVDGFYSSVGKFHVLSISHPQAEDRLTSLDSLGYLDFNWDYSKNGKIDLTMKSLTQQEIKLHKDHKIIVLGGGLYLDDLDIITKLKKTLHEIESELHSSLESRNSDNIVGEGYTIIHDRPISIIFNGPFVSRPLTVTEGSSSNHMTSSGLYKASFDNLASILEQFKCICEHCKLVFVPGDEDPWLSMVTRNSNSVWPKMKIPAVFGTRLLRVAKDVVWASNPCRINYLSQDIAIMRDDIGETLRRNDFSYLCELSREEIEKATHHSQDTSLLRSIQQQLSNVSIQDLAIDRLTSKESSEMQKYRKIVKTLLDQGVMTPFVSSVRPILTNYWPLLSLFPLPDCLILSDTTSPPLTTMYRGCLVSNVGKFYNNGCANYLEYYPSSQTAKLKNVY